MGAPTDEIVHSSTEVRVFRARVRFAVGAVIDAGDVVAVAVIWSFMFPGVRRHLASCGFELNETSSWFSVGGDLVKPWEL